MLKRYGSYLLLFAVLATFSCKRTPCFKASLTFGLIAFTEAEADTIFVRRYDKSVNFAVAKDSFLCTASYRKLHDTLELASFSGALALEADYDYRLVFPGAGKVFSITGLQEEQKDIRHSVFNNVKVGCENKITGLKVDGLPVVPPGLNYFYLTK